jgi:dTDP-4-amino-4,6-dideoxygalactose transaminase
MQVPLLDLKRQWVRIREAALANVTEVLDQQACVLGPRVKAFEEAVAEHCRVPHAIGCASGTDAILVGLRALDVQHGEEVVTTPFTFFATGGAIVNAKGRPVFVDIERDSFNIDPRQIEDAITERTRAIVPVHLYGQVADMDAILEIAGRRGLGVLEDAAQAIGSACQDRPAGSMGDIGAFSFYPSKNLGGVGDGGMIVTRRDDLEPRLRSLRTHGGSRLYEHDEVGWNSRLDAIQVAVLQVKLPLLEGWSATRRSNAAYYDAAFADVDAVTPPPVGEGKRHIYNQYVIRAERRDELRSHLSDNGIGSQIYYPVPLDQQPCFADLGYRKGQFPESDRAALESLSIPVHPELREDERAYVAETIRKFYGA